MKGIWAENSRRILDGVARLPELPWSIRLIVDEAGRDTGFATLRGFIADGERAVFDDVASTHRLIGWMHWRGFPRPDYSWAAEGYLATPESPMPDPWSLPEVAACEAWAYSVRHPDRFLPPDRPRFAVCDGDFVDTDEIGQLAGVTPSGEAPVKQWDAVLVWSRRSFDELEYNWTLGARCAEHLAAAGLSVLVVSGRPVPDLSPSAGVDVRIATSDSEILGYLVRSRLAAFPNFNDAAPPYLTEALALGLPVLVFAGALGGWQYVREETGRFFRTEFDITAEAIAVLSSGYDTSSWFSGLYGRDNSAQVLAHHLRSLGGPTSLGYAIPSSIFV